MNIFLKRKALSKIIFATLFYQYFGKTLFKISLQWKLKKRNKPQFIKVLTNIILHAFNYVEIWSRSSKNWTLARATSRNEILALTNKDIVICKMKVNNQFDYERLIFLSFKINLH